MTDYERNLVKVFMDAQAQPEGRMFSENVLAGLKAVLTPVWDELLKAKGLLAEADVVLGRYWCDGSYNNEDVIECSKKITDFLEGSRPGDARE